MEITKTEGHVAVTTWDVEVWEWRHACQTAPGDKTAQLIVFADREKAFQRWEPCEQSVLCMGELTKSGSCTWWYHVLRLMMVYNSYILCIQSMYLEENDVRLCSHIEWLVDNISASARNWKAWSRRWTTFPVRCGGTCTIHIATGSRCICTCKKKNIDYSAETVRREHDV
jgi:hypothetical protein